MNLSKLTRLISSTSIFLLMGAGTQALAASNSPQQVLAAGPDATAKVKLEAQRQILSSNPLCSLATALDTESNAVLVSQFGTAQASSEPNWAITLFERFAMNLGLADFVRLDSPSLEPVVAVRPNSALANNDGAQLVSYNPSSSKTYQVWLQDQPIATLRSQAQAEQLGLRLEGLVRSEDFEAEAIAPTIYEGSPAIAVGETILFSLDEAVSDQPLVTQDILAIQWANNLRLALGAPALEMVDAQQKMYRLVETGQSLQGTASWYGPYFHGRLTANGETYDQYGLTAAHPSMPLGSFLKVTNLNNDQSMIVRINDRGPYIPPRSLDLSLGAAQCLQSVGTGVIPYKATVMQQTSEAAAEDPV